MVVDVGDRDRWEALAQRGGELRGRERAATELEEVALERDLDRAELIGPALGQPARRFVQAPVRSPRRRRRRGPRQRAAVHFARRALRQLVECDDQRNERLREVAAPSQREPRPGRRRRRRRRRAACCRRSLSRTTVTAAFTPGRSLQLGVDLAELDPPAADLDLMVAAADEREGRRSSRGRCRRCG